MRCKRSQAFILGSSSILLFGTQILADELPLVSPPISIEQQVEEVSARLVGVMETSAQAAANTNAPDVRMTTCEVRLDSTAPSVARTVFLYQEQALSSRLQQPYRQRFLRLSPSVDRGSVQSTAFRPLNLSRWINFCNQPAANRTVQLDDLATAHCSVFLHRVGEDYIGETQPGGCPSNYRGAIRVTNHIVLQPAAMETRDRGFDISGNQVWGSTDEPYRFQHRNLPASDANQ